MNYTVYIGSIGNNIVYVGTTVQEPSERFRWHKANGKDLIFKVVNTYDNPDAMLNREKELIDLLKPKLNKITHRKQNLNVRLTSAKLELRKGNKEWCQSCLRRRVNAGYTYCYYCQGGK